MLQHVHIHAKQRAYDLSYIGRDGSERTIPLTADEAQKVIDANIVRLRRVSWDRNRISFRRLSQRGVMWLTPANPSRGAAFKVVS